jgi:hypothetical protein
LGFGSTVVAVVATGVGVRVNGGAGRAGGRDGRAGVVIDVSVVARGFAATSDGAELGRTGVGLAKMSESAGAGSRLGVVSGALLNAYERATTPNRKACAAAEAARITGKVRRTVRRLANFYAKSGKNSSRNRWETTTSF